MAQNRKLYQASYVDDEDDDTSNSDPNLGNVPSNATPENEPDNPEERTYKKRYGDLRTYTNNLTERIKNLEIQLQAANKKEFKMPSSEEELNRFATDYPDIYRHVQSIAMKELLREKEDLAKETDNVRGNLKEVQKELGLAKILKAHPDFHDLNNSERFHEWASTQPKQIQDWLFEDDDPNLCIKAISMYKAETKPVEQPRNRPSARADAMVDTRSTSYLTDDSGRKPVFYASQIRKMNPRQFAEMEAAIDLAAKEGRIEMDE